MSASAPDVDGEEGDGCGALSGIDSSANALTTGTSAGFDTGRAVTTFLSLRVLTMIALWSGKSTLYHTLTTSIVRRNGEMGRYRTKVGQKQPMILLSDDLQFSCVAVKFGSQN